MPAGRMTSSKYRANMARARAQAAVNKKFNSGNMKKTTKRGAYNKNRKRNFAIRRAPFVENEV